MKINYVQRLENFTTQKPSLKESPKDKKDNEPWMKGAVMSNGDVQVTMVSKETNGKPHKHG